MRKNRGGNRVESSDASKKKNAGWSDEATRQFLVEAMAGEREGRQT